MFSLGEYTVTFEKKKLTDCYAKINAEAEGCIATVTVSDMKEWTDDMVDLVAKHECIHLLLTRLTEIGSRRFTSQEEIDAENERVACILEKLL